MRAKRKLILTTAFAALLGVGVFGGVSLSKEASKPVKVEAAQNTYNFYIAINTDKDVKVYYNAGYNVSGLVDCSKNGETYHGLSVYTASIKDSGSAINFDQVLVQLFSGGQWSEQKTIISSWSAFTHSNQIFKYSDSSWNTYSPDVDPSSTTKSYYLYDPNSVFSSFANIKIYGFGQPETTKPDSWPGQHSRVTSGVQLGVTSMYQINLSESFTELIVNDGTKQTVDVTASGNTGKVLVIENTTDGEGKYKVHWDNSAVYSNCNTANVYLDAFDWSALYVYTFETVSGNNVEYYGKFPGKKIDITDGNLRFNGGMMQLASIPYYSIGNAKFIYSDGTDSHKSGNLSLTAGSYYWHNGSAWTSNAAQGSAAAFVYDLNTARLAVPSSSSIKQYSICGLDAKTWVDRYDGLASVAGAQGYVDAATIYTYKDKSSTGADTTVSFSEIITELRNKAYPNSVKISLLGNITSESGNSITIIISITAVCLAAIGGYFLFKKKHQ